MNPKPKNQDVPSIEALLQKITELEQGIDEAHQRELRALADLQNFQRRESENKIYWSRDAICAFLTPLLPKFSELEKGKDHTQDADIQKTIESFLQTLSKMGLHKIEPQPQELVDPDYHEVVMLGEGKSGEIVQVLESGWQFQERVVKPAKVSAGSL